MRSEMTEYRKIFEEYGCLYLGQLLSENECKEALLKLFIAKENGESIHDGMNFSCSFPDRQLDYLLSKVQPVIEKLIDVKLFPTYTYSRIYHRSDIMQLHVDRNACEISVTMTLGYGGDSIWPLIILPKKETKKLTNYTNDGSLYEGEKIEITSYVRERLEKITIGIGDGILYKGMELGHGRDKFVEGDWQAQVFLHFVDANGLYKEHKYDQIKRGTINGSGYGSGY